MGREEGQVMRSMVFRVSVSGRSTDTPRGDQRASLGAQLVTNPPAMRETPVRFLGREDPLEKG